MNDKMREHWDKVYKSREFDNLGWYEEISTPSLNLFAKCNVNKEEIILDIGSGASTLIDSLIQNGFENIIATDISEMALAKLKKRLGKKVSNVKFIVEDITNPIQFNKIEDVAVWHDRAVLHFLLEEDEIRTYFSTLKKLVKMGGYVIIAAFSTNGAKKCSGLEIRNYDKEMLVENLGEEFKLLDFFDYEYKTPSGNTRPYIYTLFQRKGSDNLYT